jgi:uroporphyrinogen-III synthase
MKRLVILRPEPGASESLTRAYALGLDAISIPLFEIEPVAWEAPDPAQFDALLLTSGNAVRCGGEQLLRLRTLKVHAVGQATAEAAREAGFDVASTGTTGVAGLLASIENRQTLLHLAGEHYTGTPGTEHGIRRITVYRSREIQRPSALQTAAGAVVAVHSPRAGRRFSQLMDQLGTDRTGIAIAAISRAAAEAAGGGWQAVATAEGPDDPSLLALARQLCDTLP